MERESCVVCNTKSSFSSIYTQEIFPVCISSSKMPPDTDIFSRIDYVGCRQCGCVQLKSLVNPLLLYSVTHNNTYDTPTWKQHHELFSEFILRNTVERDFLEIGGASGYLAELLSSKTKIGLYTVIDLANPPSSSKNLEYIQANCEDFSFKNIPKERPIILSHVFEHLYQPRKFLERLNEANMKTVFLSVPNMEICLQKKFLSFLHVEHTYYCDKQHILCMMEESGYTCTAIEYFKEHSLFFKFERSDKREKLTSYPDASALLEKFQAYYKERDELYKSIELTMPTYIVPGGHYGQLIYHYLRNQKNKILGFLDNDRSKIGQRMYGTDKYVYSMKEIASTRGTRVGVLINAGPYLQEIKTQLLELNPDIDFVCV